MKSCHLCGTFALAFAPCAQAVSITQTTSITGSAFSESTAKIFGGWNFAPYATPAAPLVSVTLVADISSHAFSDWLIPFPNGAPITIVPFLSTSTQFNFFLEPFVYPAISSIYVEPSRLLFPFVPYFTNADFTQHWERTFTSAAELAIFTHANPRLLFVSEFNGSGSFGGVSGSETVTMALTYVYAGPATGVPETGYAAALLAFACMGILIAHRRQEPGME